MTWLTLGFSALLIAQASNAWAVEKAGEEVLRDFISGKRELAQPLATARPRQLSDRRWEIQGESDGKAYAVAAYRKGGDRVLRSFLPTLCRVALVRPHLTGLAPLRERYELDDGFVETLIETAIGGAQLKNVRLLPSAINGDWDIQSCSVAQSDINPLNLDREGDQVVAALSYDLAKAAIGADDRLTALTHLKRTTRVASVYANAVGFMIPVLDEVNPEIAHKLWSAHLRLNDMSDPDALAYLALWMEGKGLTEQAAKAYRRCTHLRTDGRTCEPVKPSADAHLLASPDGESGVR
jgi:hypothetical protein